MGKANFSHLASQNILLIIFLIIFIHGPPRLLVKGVGHNQRYSVLVFIFIFVLLTGWNKLSQKCEEMNNIIKNNDIRSCSLNF